VCVRVCVCVCVRVSVCVSVRVTAVAERKFSSRVLCQCQPSHQQAEKPSRQRPAMSVTIFVLIMS